jgi:copper chaperone CopZ
MKLAILKTFLAAAFLLFCFANIQAQDKVETVEVKVTGMMCGGCASKVYKVLQETAGVIDNEVKYPGDVAIVKYNPEKTNPDTIVGAIEEGTDFSAALKEES